MVKIMDPMESKVLEEKKDLRTIKNGINKIENQGKKWYKIPENGPIVPMLSNIISVTKCDRDEPLFSAERGSIRSSLGINKGPNGIENVKRGGHSQGSCPPPSTLGMPPSHPRHFIQKEVTYGCNTMKNVHIV